MKNIATIKTYNFSDFGREVLGSEKLGKDWPVVYIINNISSMYIGETSCMYNRFNQHLKNPEKASLTKMNVIFDDEFNKSAILDLEQLLIHLCATDSQYELLNMNAGQSATHNYHQREKYLNKIDLIWSNMQKLGLAKSDYQVLKNSELFKYSPYISLTKEQSEVCYDVIDDIIEKLTKGIDATSIINGSAGTGKTIVGINIIFTLVNAMKIKVDSSIDEIELTREQKTIHDLQEFLKDNRNLNIAYVMPMVSLRKTVKRVFKLSKNGLTSSMVIGPSDVVKENYDILLVDESHRLSQRKNITAMGAFDKTCRALGLIPEETTQLDWIVKCSKYRILFYDKAQTIKGSDIDVIQFSKALKDSLVNNFYLTTQMRCSGGNTYIEYINDIFECNQIKPLKIENYDFRFFEDVTLMEKEIREKNKKIGLCRIVAGYSWKWISKSFESRDVNEIKKAGMSDIDINGNKYVWNLNNEEYMLREDSINEVGCVHTVQGYDGNIMGIIFGLEIDYDPSLNKIVINLSKFYDSKVKTATDENTVKQYIINSYKVMMSRGIKGCYIYVCNSNLREYLRKFVI